MVLRVFGILSAWALQLVAEETEKSVLESLQWTEVALKFQEKERLYRTFVPAELPDKAPVVLLLHGGTQSMRKIFREKAGGSRYWADLAEKEKFLLIVPNGTSPKDGNGTSDKQVWNDLRPKDTAVAKVDDVGFLKAVVEEVEKKFRTDPERVYVTGSSNGGMMTFRLLIEAPERFAAGAAFIASLPAKIEVERPKMATPLMMMSGTKDPLVKWEGGPILKVRGEVMSQEDNLQWWIETNRVDPESVKEELIDDDPKDKCKVHGMFFPAKKGGAPILFYQVEGGGHAMPSKTYQIPNNFLTRKFIGPVCRDVEGADVAWTFLSQHRRVRQ